jgi:hypothetical protein
MQRTWSEGCVIGVAFALVACGGARAGSGVYDARGPGASGSLGQPEVQELGPEVRREIGLDEEPGNVAELSPELRREIGLDGQPAMERDLSPELRREIGLDAEPAGPSDRDAAAVARVPATKR